MMDLGALQVLLDGLCVVVRNARAGAAVLRAIQAVK